MIERDDTTGIGIGMTRSCRGALSLLITALMAAPAAIAQLSSGDQLPDALKQVKPTSGVCRANDDLTAPLTGIFRSEVTPDTGCAITALEARSALTRNGLLADLRPPSEYDQFHIEGALSLSLAALSSKPYWREKDVLLIGSGKNEREVYRSCARLKQAGYKNVRVLRGGMPEWLASGLEIVGKAPTAQQLSRLSAVEFWLESQNPENLVVLAKEQSALQGELAFSIKLNERSADAIKAVLERRRRELKNAPLSGVVLAAAPSISDDEVQRLQVALRPVPLLLYTGTHEEVVRYVTTQKAIWVAQARGPKQLACGL